MEFSPYILTQRLPMEMEAGILSGLNQVTFARIFLFGQALVFVGLIVSAPSRQIQGQHVNAQRDTLYSMSRSK